MDDRQSAAPKGPYPTPPWWRRIPLQLLVEIAVFIVGVRVACIYSKQLNQMIEGNTISRQILITDQRAWVGVVSADPPKLKPSPDFFVTLHVTNSGHTPALNFQSATVLHSLGKDETFQPVYGGLTEIPSRGVIQPTEVIFLQTNRFPIEQSQIDWIRNGKFILYVYGRMSYEDIFKVTHHTTFCKEILSESLIRDCGTYNAAD